MAKKVSRRQRAARRRRYDCRDFLKGKSGLLDIDVDDEWTLIYCCAAAIAPQAAKCISDPHLYQEQVGQFNLDFRSPENLEANGQDLEEEEEESQLDDVDRQGYGVEPEMLTFIKLNAKRWGFAINVFVVNDKSVHPLAIGLGCSNKARKMTINLLQLDAGNATYRYILVNNLNSFLRKYYDPNKKLASCQNRVYCVKCLRYFSSQKLLDQHQPQCVNYGVQIEKMPTETDDGLPPVTKFKDFYKKYPPKVKIVFDFESIVANTNNICVECASSNSLRGARCHCPMGENSSMTNMQQHHAAIYAYCVIDGKGQVLHEKYGVCPRGMAAEKMIDDWLQLEEKLLEVTRHQEPIKMTAEDEEDFQKATHCSICEEPFTAQDLEKKGKGDRVRDHCHLSGSYLGKFYFCSCRQCFLICFLLPRGSPSNMQSQQGALSSEGGVHLSQCFLIRCCFLDQSPQPSKSERGQDQTFVKELSKASLAGLQLLCHH